jgi:hypothetical protein
MHEDLHWSIHSNPPKKKQNMNVWKHYFGALEAIWHYMEMWLDLIFENEGEKGEDDEGNDDGEKKVVVK